MLDNQKHKIPDEFSNVEIESCVEGNYSYCKSKYNSKDNNNNKIRNV